MATVNKANNVKEVAAFDTKKSYQWQPEDQFILNGQEFSVLYTVLKNEVYLPGGTSIKQKIDAFTILEEVMREAVESGVAKEVSKEADTK